MATFRYRDDDSSGAGVFLGLAGALAGFAVGVLVAQRMGGVSGLTSRLRERFGMEEEEAGDSYDEYEGDEFESEGAWGGEYDETLEERVLEAFRNDPVLSERAIDIGAIGDETIELSGWVRTEEEAEHAVTVARGTPGVATVVNRLGVGEEEQRLEENARRVAAGDPALTERKWQGQRVGTGRRRQGDSSEIDRHADPKPILEERWLDERHAIEAAADENVGMDEPRSPTKRPVRGDRTGGSPVAPSGVPKGDHVADPAEISDTRGEKRPGS